MKGEAASFLKFNLQGLMALRREFVTCLVLAALESLVAIAVARALNRAMRVGLDLPPAALAALAGLGLTALVLRYLSTFADERLANRFRGRSERRLYASLMRGMPALSAQLSRAEILHRVHADHQLVLSVAGAGAVGSVKLSLRAVLVLGYLAYTHPVAPIFVVLAGLLFLPLVLLLRVLLRRRAESLAGAHSRLFVLQKNLVEGYETYYVAGALASLQVQHGELLAGKLEDEDRLARFKALQAPCGELARLVFAAGLWGSWKLRLLSAAAPFPLGALYLGLHVLGSGHQLLWSLLQLQPALAAWTRLTPLLRTVEDETGATPGGSEGKPRLSATELVVYYGRQQISGAGPFSFDVSAGQRVLVRGSSGSGKTTLLLSLLGLHRNTRGELACSGVARHAWGYLSQEPYFFAGSFRENLFLPRQRNSGGETHEAQEVVLRELLTGLELEDFWKSLPQGADTPLGMLGLNPSRGQLQRLALLRELLRQPRILLLDEPCTGMETALAARVLACAAQRMRAGILVVAEHRAEVADILPFDISIALGGERKDGLLASETRAALAGGRL